MWWQTCHLGNGEFLWPSQLPVDRWSARCIWSCGRRFRRIGPKLAYFPDEDQAWSHMDDVKRKEALRLNREVEALQLSRIHLSKLRKDAALRQRTRKTSITL